MLRKKQCTRRPGEQFLSHLDDTPTRVNGQNQSCHVICNPLYTAYFTKPGKDRLSVLDVLRQGRKREYLLNAEALAYLEGCHFPRRRDAL